MKSLSVTLIVLLVLIAVTNAALETHLCVDMSHDTPCKGWPAGLYPVCFGCGMGFFAECQGDEATVLNCPTVQDANGYPSILMFDNVTKICVEKTDSCPEKKSCVDMAAFAPCEGLPDRRYHLCNNDCKLGYFAWCNNEKDVTIKRCTHVDDGNGGYYRLRFDTLSQSCIEESTSCASHNWSSG
ncbi:hypothetical protein PoB_003840400 [Plakobranchus ocellatus]|uniref:Uncharacterized protein n=1 Tax=Plakobranchus ocellatus TaxID=259542 RepID=A0AAV4AVT4_9GAST|nr:hypothetical protein PoB_003840400 [Plakobranchus ocellatus]